VSNVYAGNQGAGAEGEFNNNKHEENTKQDTCTECDQNQYCLMTEAYGGLYEGKVIRVLMKSRCA
jgi:hypothetical protein